MGIRSNNKSESYYNYFGDSGTDAMIPGVHPGMYATGGDIANRLQPGNGYVYHTFGADGTFTVNYALTNVEVLLQGGGGGGRGGGGAAGGGGGAGGIYLATIPALPVGNYTIDIAAATTGGAYNAPVGSLDGKKTIFNPGGPAPLSYEAGGGGGAGGYGPPTPQLNGRPGTSNGNGAGGGGGAYPTGGTKGADSPMGRTGGDGEGGGDSAQAGGGGGGAGPPSDANFTSTSTLGEPGSPGGPRSKYRSWGGFGSQMDNYNYDLICDPTAPNGSAAATSLGQLDGYFGGGGAGAIREATNQIAARGGRGGGAWGGIRTAAISGGDANAYSGGGGGGDSPGNGGDGASGILVVRYAEQVKSPSPGAKATGGVITTYNGKTIHTFRNTGTFTTPASFNETVEYVVIGGGGSGGARNSDNPGGGGAGAYLTNSTPISGANTIPVQVGDGGYRHAPSSDDGGLAGYPSFFGPTRVAAGGGGGGVNAPGSPTAVYPGRAGYPGGSGGGGGYGNGTGGTGSGDPFPGTIGATPANGWGHDGATAVGSNPYYCAGGGGGAGSAGESSPTVAHGGAGIQLPATFRDPAAAATLGYPGPTSAPTPNGFDTSGKYWFCGGGGGGIDGDTGRAPNPVAEGGGPGGPYAGAGPAGDGHWPAPGTPVATGSGLGVDAKANSGSGGGGNSVNALGNYGAGGSGIVLVAYPS